MKIESTPVFKDGYPRTGFVFYQSFYEALQDIPNDDKMAIVQAIIEYGLYGKESDLLGLHKIVFTLIKPQIDANQKKYVNGQKGAEHGVKAGKLEIINPKAAPEEPQEDPKATPKEKVKAKVKEKVKEKKNEQTKVFTPPAISEMKQYFAQKIAEKGLLLDANLQAEKFDAHYGSIGWMVGNKIMVDWKKSASGWILRATEKKPQNKQGNNYEPTTERAL